MEDKLNCIKNMMWMMCCDGDIAEREKKFLSRAARKIGLEISDWNGLLQEVLADGTKLYTISDRDRASSSVSSNRSIRRISTSCFRQGVVSFRRIVWE